nr:MAG TPA: hypothetical protein [Caudoviricetes sp.]
MLIFSDIKCGHFLRYILNAAHFSIFLTPLSRHIEE